MAEGPVWGIYQRGELVGEVDEQEHDFPWIRGRLRPQPAFEPLRPLFAWYSEAVDSGDGEAIDRAYDAIRVAVTMRYPDGRQVPEFMLSVEGDEAAFRWADEPFDE